MALDQAPDGRAAVVPTASPILVFAATRLLPALGAGLSASAAQPPAPGWAALGLALALPLLMLMQGAAETRRRAFLIGWAAGTAYFGFGLRWIAEAFLVDAEAHAWMAPFAVGGLAAGLALFWGAAFALAPRGRGLAGAVALAGIWALAEFARGHVLTGFPWALFAYAFIETPLSQTGALIGPYGQTLAALIVAALLAGFWRSGRGGGALRLAAAAALIGGGWLYGAARLAEPPAAQSGGPLVGIIQPNIPQKEKWDPALMPRHLGLLLEEARRLSDAGARAVIWPESAAPWPLEHPDMLALAAQALGPQTTLIAGTQRVERAAPGSGASDRWFNAVTTVDSEGRIGGTFDKRHLVPFGEYMPLKGVMDSLGVSKLVQAPGDFSEGEAPRLMHVEGLPPFAPLICYEAIFPGEVLDSSGDRPGWFVHVTNDAWFGVSAGPWQHLAQARARAIERGLPVLRAANTGISAVVDSRGRILDSVGINQRGSIVAAPPPAAARTAYDRRGEVPFLAVLSLCLLAGLRRSGRSA